MEVESNNAQQKSYEQDDLVDLLKQYYKLLFPHKLYHKWLQYGHGTKNFENREFSFTLKDDVYIRYLSFTDSSELEKELQKKVPYKIDIGAIYNYKPKDHKTLQAGSFKPVGKELVFDIDMTDYDDVRTCCSGASICKKCWMFMNVAIKVLDTALQEDFGFEHLLWVYSGRRGVHCWVADNAARKLTQAGRSAVAEYLSVIRGGDSQTKKVNFKGASMHPSLSRANKIVQKFFTEHYLEEQNILESKEQEKIMLKLIPDETTREKVETAWNESTLSCIEKWNKLESIVGDKFSDKFILSEIMFQYVYPRLDINVTKGLNHLLKSPFCVHPKTGRVCIPIDAKVCEKFDPMIVPTISDLLQELDNAKEEDTNTKSKKEEFMKTSLSDSIEIFTKFINGIEKQNNEVMREENEKKERNGNW